MGQLVETLLGDSSDGQQKSETTKSGDKGMHSYTIDDAILYALGGKI